MKLHALSRRAARYLMVGGAGLAIAAPSALASTDGPGRPSLLAPPHRSAPHASTPRRSIAVVPPDLRDPDQRQLHAGPRLVSTSGAGAAHQPAATLPPRIVTTSAPGFDWRSAAIGGGIFAGVAALLWLAATGIARRGRAHATR